MILVLLTLFVFILYAGLLIYYSYGWNALATYQTSHEIEKGVFISVIIPARDEEQNIAALLAALKMQSYAADNFEVIIVDDHSSDRTAEIVSTFPMRNLTLIRLADHVSSGINSYKKKAIEIAISQCKGELIVTTDADCIVTTQWLQTIALFYAKHNPAMIIMPVAIQSGKSLLNIFQALDFMTLQGVTGGAVYHRLHAMCNGANLAYTKKIFNEVNGFEGVDALASGDDMFLMNKIHIYKPGSIRYLKSQKVIVSTGPMQTIRAFFNQRIRWASKTAQFKHAPIMASAFIVYLLNLLLLVLPIAAVFNNELIVFGGLSLTPVTIWLFILATKILVELFFLYPVASFFNQLPLLLYFPFIQPLHIVYTLIAGGLGRFGKYHWKGRTVK